MNAISLISRVFRRIPSYDPSEYLDEINAAYKETWDYILQLDASYFTDIKIVTVAVQGSEFDFLYNSNGNLTTALSPRYFQIDRIRILQPGDSKWSPASPQPWNDSQLLSLEAGTPQNNALYPPYPYTPFAKGSVKFAAPLQVGTQIEVIYSFIWLPLTYITNGTVSAFTSISDTFNRANQSPIIAPWVVDSGTPQILSNQFTGTAGLGCEALYDGGTAWPHDQFSQAQIITLNPGKGFAGLVLHSSGYQLGIDTQLTAGGLGLNSTLKFIRNVAPVGTIATFGILPQSGDTLKAQIIGQTLSFFQNGNLVGSFIDPNPPVPLGKPGLNASPGAGVATDIVWDNWVGGSAGGVAIAGTGTSFTQVLGPDFQQGLPGNEEDTDIGLEMIFNFTSPTITPNASQIYRVRSVSSDTALTTITTANLASFSSVNYCLAMVPDIPEGHHNVIATIATANMLATYDVPGNETKLGYWAGKAKEELDSMRDSVQTRQRQAPARRQRFPQSTLRRTASAPGR